jgi:Sec-independent protein translocase protein TatA
MASKSKDRPETGKSQIERFKEAARELECEDDPEAFKAKLKKLTEAPPPESVESRKKKVASAKPPRQDAFDENKGRSEK